MAKASTDLFRDEFESLLSRDFMTLDNVSKIVWRNGNPGHFLVVVTPKSEDVYDAVKEHVTQRIRGIAKELLFKAEAQELVINRQKSMVFKVTPLESNRSGAKSVQL